jgi:hypothetical protein
MRRLPSYWKTYQIRLIIPDNGIPIIEYNRLGGFVGSSKPPKSIHFVDLLFADKKHDTSEKSAFAIYTIDKTFTFLASDEIIMNEWLTKIRELHSDVYPDFKRYDAIFEASLINKGIVSNMHIGGHYRLALCKDSLDLIPLWTQQLQQQQDQDHALKMNPIANTNQSHNFQRPSPNQHHLKNRQPRYQGFYKRHPLLGQRTIELVLRHIRRCGHTNSNFYIESGRQSHIGEGDMWMNLKKKSTAKDLHELLLATMKQASTECQILYKAPRSRSGSASKYENTVATSNLFSQPEGIDLAAELKRAAAKISSSPLQDDNDYLPMA